MTFAHPQAWQLTQALIDRGVVPDFRTPDRVRLGPAPLYTRFVDVWDAMDRFRAVLDERRPRDLPRRARPGHLRSAVMAMTADQAGSGTPIGLPVGHSPAAMTARRTGPAARRAGRSPPSPSARHGPSASRSVSASIGGDHRQALGGEARRRPASRARSAPRPRRPRPSSSQPRALCSHSRVLRPAAAASTCALDAVDLPLQQRGVVPVAAVLAQRGQRLPQRQVRLVRERGRRRWPRPAAGRACRPPRRPRARTRAASAASAEPIHSSPSTRRTARVDPASRAASASAAVAASQTAGTRRATKAGREVVEDRRHDLGPDRARAARRAARSSRLPEPLQAQRPHRRPALRSAK